MRECRAAAVEPKSSVPQAHGKLKRTEEQRHGCREHMQIDAEGMGDEVRLHVGMHERA